MGGKTAPTANGYVISISLAGRISRGSREKVSIVKKNLIDFPWNQDPVKKNRIIIDVSRPRKTTALVSTTIYLGNLSPPFRHRYNNNTDEFIPFFVERNPPRYFFDFYLRLRVRFPRGDTLLSTRYVRGSSPPRNLYPPADSSQVLFYHKRSVPMRSAR